MDIITTNSYSEYKQMLDKELKTNVESFVRIGYLLKIARDTNILAESGYNNVAEFAKAEYGLSKDIVSRYIAINDRYSENGYSDRLQDRFENYGVAKLSEMLTLPDNIIAEIEPTLTRKEIQDIKKEIAEEEKVTPLEVMAEAAEEKNARDEEAFSETQRIWKEYFHANKDEYLKIANATKSENKDKNIEALFDLLAPTGCQIKWARIPGSGRYMISVKGKNVPVVYTNVRDGRKIESSSEDVYSDILDLFGKHMTIESWSALYGESFEAKEAINTKQQDEENEAAGTEKGEEHAKKEKVAPVQQQDEPERIVDAEIIEPKKIDGQNNAKENDSAAAKVAEYKNVKDMLWCLTLMRQKLEGHDEEDSERLSDNEVNSLAVDIDCITDIFEKIKAGRDEQ